MKEFVIISLGGSIVVPEEIDVQFLRKFRSLVLNQVKKGRNFIIIVGGGKTCRKYQAAASQIAKVTSDDLDWIGIHAIRLNAHLLRTIFREIAYTIVVRKYDEKVYTKKPVIIAAAWKPGHSSDYDAVMWAKNLKAREIINLSDIDYVYDKDPKYHKGARRFERISWKEFRKIVGSKWISGLNVPFDPIASGEAQSLGLKVVVMNGRNLKNLESFLNGRKFKGTIIE